MTKIGQFYLSTVTVGSSEIIINDPFWCNFVPAGDFLAFFIHNKKDSRFGFLLFFCSKKKKGQPFWSAPELCACTKYDQPVKLCKWGCDPKRPAFLFFLNKKKVKTQNGRLLNTTKNKKIARWYEIGSKQIIYYYFWWSNCNYWKIKLSYFGQITYFFCKI